MELDWSLLEHIFERASYQIQGRQARPGEERTSVSGFARQPVRAGHDANMKTQTEAVVETMERNGGYATLKHLYENVPGVKDTAWNTKTPFASIRRIVQLSRQFFKVRPGLWALESHRNKLPGHIAALLSEPGRLAVRRDTASHYFYQGILTELGNMRGFKTYVPAQDKNRPFMERRLGDIAATTSLPSFTYDDIVMKVKSVDAMWFNRRRFPDTVFEVEFTTDFNKSLMKFQELVDFNINMTIVAPEPRRREYDAAVRWDVFTDLKARVDFWTCDRLIALHAHQAELHATEQAIAKTKR